MENQKKDTKNEVVIVGTAVSKVFPLRDSRNMMILVVATSGSSSRTNYPHIAFYGKDVVDALDKSLTVDRNTHPHVMVKAVVETTKRMRDGVATYHQTIVGKTVMNAPTKLDAALNHPGITPIDDINRVSIIGEVVHVFQMGNHKVEDGTSASSGYIITVKTFEDNGRFSFPKVICFSRSSAAVKDVKVGDVIATVGLIQTRDRKSAKPGESTESIVCSDITIL